MFGITKKDITVANRDILESFKYWRIFYLMGSGDIRKRYARSKLGQVWLSLSLAINISLIGLVWSYLFKNPIQEYMPYFTVSMIFWTYISTCVMEGANLYITCTQYLKELIIPKTSYINSLIVRNMIIFSHNLVVLVLVFLIFQVKPPVAGIFLSLLGLLLSTIFVIGVAQVLAIICLRYRDFPNIILSMMQLAFYLTPVLWRIEALPERVRGYMLLNPFVVFLTICRDPLLDKAVPTIYWFAALVYIVISLGVGWLFFSRFRKRITYWL
ncbi:MAG: ABC transporter permease [Rickettsiales bacterium]